MFVLRICITCALNLAETVFMIFFAPLIHQVHTLEHCAQ